MVSLSLEPIYLQVPVTKLRLRQPPAESTVSSRPVRCPVLCVRSVCILWSVGERSSACLRMVRLQTPVLPKEEQIIQIFIYREKVALNFRYTSSVNFYIFVDNNHCCSNPIYNSVEKIFPINRYIVIMKLLEQGRIYSIYVPGQRKC